MQSSLQGMVRSGLNLISQAISIHDRELRLVHANKTFQDMFSLPDTLIRPGADFEEILFYLAERGEYGPLDDVAGFVGEKVALARLFKPHYFERTRANGTAISVDGNPLEEGGWISVYTDISQIKEQEKLIRSRAQSLSDELLKRSEDLARTNRQLSATVRALEAAKLELTESRARLDLINRMTPAHIAHVDATGRYTHTNGQLSKITGQPQKEIMGRPMSDVLGDHIWQQIAPHFDQVVAGQAVVLEIQNAARTRYIRLAMSPDIDEAGCTQGAFILSTDVTEEALARAGLAHVRRRELASQLTSAMAHDFSNLMTIIIGQQALLERDAGLSDSQREISDTIKSAARRGTELIESLNRLSPQRQVDPGNVRLSAFRTQLMTLAQATLPEGFTLSIEISTAHPTLVFDAGFAQDALLNLVLNAVEACGSGGHIDLQIGQSADGYLAFLASDNGPGFSDDALRNAVTPFFSTKTGKVGRGLGLTSAYDFAKTCGGHLALSNRPGGGAAVSLKIPYLAATPVGNGMILLVDDDDALRQTLASQLRGAGHSLIEAASVEEAGKLVDLDGLSLIISDLAIGPNGTGLDVARLAPAQVPVLVITGLPASDPLHQEAAAAHRVLGKHQAVDKLCDLVAGYLP